MPEEHIYYFDYQIYRAKQAVVEGMEPQEGSSYWDAYWKCRAKLYEQYKSNGTNVIIKLDWLRIFF